MRRSTVLFLILAIGAGCACAGIDAAFHRDMAEARRCVAPGTAPVVQTWAGTVEYAERGPADGYPLLSIHGAGGGWDQGLANVAALVGGNFRVIAPSRFGYLATPIPADRSSVAQANAHLALLDTLKIEKAVVVGVSAGARSAVDLALHNPERVAALILISPATYSPDAPVSVDRSPTSRVVLQIVNAGGDFAWWVAEKIAPKALARFVGVPPEVIDNASPADRAEVIAVVNAIEPLSMRFQGINIDSNPDLHPLPLNSIAVPSIVISAKDDLFNTLPAARYLAENIPAARLRVFETGGHLLVGHNKQVRDLLRNFLLGVGLTDDMSDRPQPSSGCQSPASPQTPRIRTRSD